MAEYYFIVYMYHIFFNHSLVPGHLGWFHSLVVVNRAAINLGMQVSLLNIDLHSFRYKSNSATEGSYGSSIFTFLRSFHTDSIVGVLSYIWPTVDKESFLPESWPIFVAVSLS
jgi:hypothetical protein